MRVAAVVLAAGSGSRFGTSEPKQFVRLGARTVLEHAVDAFLDALGDGVDEVWVVTAAEHVERSRALLSGRAVAGVVPGGAVRHESTRHALDALAPDVTHVLVHDAARPLVTRRTIDAAVAAFDHADVVATLVPVDDTVVVVESGAIVATPDRATLRAHQTPQGFRVDLLAEALATPVADATDDVTIVLRAHPEARLALVEGDARARKLTRPDDLAVLTALLG